jgi:hypothetical protein
LPADCPILRIFTAWVPRGSKGIPANSRRLTSGFPTGAPSLKSAALPVELTTRMFLMLVLGAVGTSDRRPDQCGTRLI